LVQLKSATGGASLAEEKAALRRVATLVARGVRPPEIFSAVSEEVGRVFGSPFSGIGRFEPNGSAVVIVGVSEGIRNVPIGTRWPLEEFLATTAVYRTGRPARNERSGWEDDSGPVASSLRELGLVSTVAAPIVVEGNVWGVITVSDAHQRLPPDAEQRLAAFTELVATAIANAEGRAELAASEMRARALAEEQAALRRVATVVARAPESERVFSIVAREVASVLNVPGVIVQRYEADGTVVTLGDAFDSELAGAERFLGVGSRMPRDPGSLAAQVFETQSPARVDDFSTLPGTIGDLARAAGLGSGCAGPIVVNGELWGKLCVFSQAGAVLPADTENRLHDFIELVATAIANYEARTDLATSESRARELAEEQAALRRVATLVARAPASVDFFSTLAREVASVLNVPAVLVGRFEDDGTVLTFGAAYSSDLSGAHRFLGVGTRMPRDPGSLAAQVYETHQAARVDDYSCLSGDIGDAARTARLGSGCGGPIAVNGELWGQLCVFSRAGTTLPVGTENRLHDFIELIATAIANHEARAELATSETRARELAEEQAALRRVATLVAEGASPNRVFDVVRDEVEQMFGIPNTILMRFDADGMATLLATPGDYLGPVGRKWLLEGDDSAVARVRRTGRAARADYTTGARGPLAEAAQRGGTLFPVAVPVVVEGDLWGAMSVGSRGPERPPPDLEGRLAKFTELLASAIANAESRADLAASEARARELASEQAALRRVATLVAQGASPDELFSAVAREVAGVVDIPVVGIHRYEADGTFTTVGVAGESSLEVGTRCSVKDEGMAGMILASGRPSRRDDYSNIPRGVVREDLRVPMVGVPVVVEGSIWGFMVAADQSGRPIPVGAEERLARFTELVATAVSNATTRADLLTSRARIVSAADETRRRLERDLHDGIQQWLVALALRARKAAAPSAGEPAVKALSGLADDLVAVTDELREISRGIHPAILSDAGLDDALEALARRSTIRVDLDVSFQRRYDPTLEATVYYVAAESITNAVKHAEASTVTVRGGRRNGAIELEISDDGVGGADPGRGTGLIGLKDRVDTLGGTISFTSPPGDGTTIRVRLPASTPASG
jgi:GAF domain-containing protein